MDDLVDRLVARAQGAPPLSAGSFSSLAADARDDQWIDQCVSESSNPEARFSTELLLRALHTADLIVTEIESQGSLLEFFAGTSRDILLYESLLFSVHALSDAVRQTLPADKAKAATHCQDVACLTVSILGPQHIGDFDSALHNQDRTQRYLAYAGKLREMTECLIDILISVRGAPVIGLSGTPSDHEVGIEIEVDLRSVVNTVVDICISDDAEKLSGRYTDRWDSLS